MHLTHPEGAVGNVRTQVPIPDHSHHGGFPVSALMKGTDWKISLVYMYREPRGNPHKHRENMETAHRKTKHRTFLLRGIGANHCASLLPMVMLTVSHQQYMVASSISLTLLEHSMTIVKLEHNPVCWIVQNPQGQPHEPTEKLIWKACSRLRWADDQMETSLTHIHHQSTICTGRGPAVQLAHRTRRMKSSIAESTTVQLQLGKHKQHNQQLFTPPPKHSIAFLFTSHWAMQERCEQRGVKTLPLLSSSLSTTLLLPGSQPRGQCNQDPWATKGP